MQTIPAARARHFGHLIIGATALMLAACSAVVNSSDLALLTDGSCHSRLGSYTLPKTHLKLTVKEYYDEAENGGLVLEEIAPVPRADPRFTYCLDYLASATSDDAVQIKKSKAPGETQTPFLQVVTSKAVDNTAIIIRKIIRTVFIGLSGNADFKPARADKVTKLPRLMAELEFDPFDPFEVADANSRLTQLGFCVTLEAFAFDTNAVAASRYCDNPRKIARSSPSIAAGLVANQPLLVKGEVRGLHYRPRAPYQLSIYTKDDPGAKEAWRLSKLETVELENASPIISLGVDRAIFAARRTAIVFDNGVLLQVCIAKGSEVEGAIGIPVDIVNGLVALPTQMLQVQILTTNLNQQVMAAEREVTKLQQQYIAYKLHGGEKPQVADKPEGTPLDPKNFPEYGKPAGFTPPTIGAIGATDSPLRGICDKLGQVAVFGDTM